MLRLAFVAFLIVASVLGGWQYYESVADSMLGPSPEDRICNDRLPGGNWSGVPRLALGEDDGVVPITCSREIATVIRANASAVSG